MILYNLALVVDDELDQFIGFQPCAAACILDILAIDIGREGFFLKPFLHTLELHACIALGAHQRVGMDET